MNLEELKKLHNTLDLKGRAELILCERDYILLEEALGGESQDFGDLKVSLFKGLELDDRR